MPGAFLGTTGLGKTAAAGSCG